MNSCSKSSDNLCIPQTPYDYVIIGGGPTGLTCAYILGKLNKKCLLVDQNDSIGGCHRVTRTNNLFSEHGPRIYSSAYKNTINLLKSMNIKFDDLFVPYTFSLSNVQTKSNMTTSEIISFIFEFSKLVFGINDSKQITVKQFMINNNFSNGSMDYIDRVCRLTDGADSNKYILYEFLQLVNVQSLYKLYQPNTPNDIGLFKLWTDKILETKNVTILSKTKALKINHNRNFVTNIIIKNSLFTYAVNCNNLILAIPPKPLYALLNKSMPNIFNVSQQWISKNSYVNYIPITYHFNQQLELPKLWGFPASEWGVAFIVLSEYIPFKSTVISTCVTITNVKSSLTGKTADESSKKRLINEVFRQLKLSYPNLPSYSTALVHDSHKFNNKWITMDTAFVGNEYIDAKSIYLNNVYTLGTHNGHSKYPFTSMESAISNAIYTLNEIEPRSKDIIEYNNRLITIVDIVQIISFCLFVGIIYYYAV